MKKLLVGLLVLGSVSSFATIYKAKLVGNTSCNTEFGIGQVQFAVYQEKSKSYKVINLNVLNHELCEKGAHRKPSKLVDMSFDAVMGGATKYLHKVTVNDLNVVTNIEKFKVITRKDKKIYKRFNYLELNNYPYIDARVLDTETLSYDETARSKAEKLRQKLFFQVGDRVIPDEARNKVGTVTKISADGFITVSKFGWIRARIFNLEDVAFTRGCFKGLCIGDKVKAPDSKCFSIVKGINYSKNTFTIHSIIETSGLIKATSNRSACTDFKIGYRRFERPMLSKQ